MSQLPLIHPVLVTRKSCSTPGFIPIKLYPQKQKITWIGLMEHFTNLWLEESANLDFKATKNWMSTLERKMELQRQQLAEGWRVRMREGSSYTSFSMIPSLDCLDVFWKWVIKQTEPESLWDLVLSSSCWTSCFEGQAQSGHPDSRFSKPDIAWSLAASVSCSRPETNDHGAQQKHLPLVFHLINCHDVWQSIIGPQIPFRQNTLCICP